MPFYEAQQKLATVEQQDEYWHATRAARASAEHLAEDIVQFGRLLLTYAEANAEKLGNDE